MEDAIFAFSGKNFVTKSCSVRGKDWLTLSKDLQLFSNLKKKRLFLCGTDWNALYEGEIGRNVYANERKAIQGNCLNKKKLLEKLNK